MNIFKCPTKGCKYEVKAIALEVRHLCKNAKNQEIELERFDPEGVPSKQGVDT
jgi:hypothetical protein